MARKKPLQPKPEPASTRPSGANGPEPPQPEPRAVPRTGYDVHLSPDDRVSLYAAARYLPTDVERSCRLKIPFLTYFKDPAVARSNPLLDFDEKFEVNWEPGLTDGPTSARFAVVDYNADTGHLAPPAVWDEPNQRFTSGGTPLSRLSFTHISSLTEVLTVINLAAIFHNTVHLCELSTEPNENTITI